MKKILILLSAVCVLAACGALRQSPEERARVAWTAAVTKWISIICVPFGEAPVP